MSVLKRIVKGIRSVEEDRQDSDLVFISKAEIVWAKQNQRELLVHAKFQEWKGQFQLLEDREGLWRCRGRLKYAHLSHDTKQ